MSRSEPGQTVRAVIFDWAGTTVDHGSLAPVGVFVAAFGSEGVEISIAHARAPMGRSKRDHIAAIAAEPEVAARWQARHGAPCSEADVERMYGAFLPLQRECVGDYAALIPGVLETQAELRSRGVGIGSSTGYTREIMDRLGPLAAELGYRPDVILTSSDVEVGRPGPWLIYENMRQLDISPPAAVVKVDDTLAGIEAGRNAGVWTVGISESGNMMGLDWQALQALDPSARRQQREAAEAKMKAAGAHDVIPSVASLMPTIDAIELRNAAGERP